MQGLIKLYNQGLYPQVCEAAEKLAEQHPQSTETLGIIGAVSFEVKDFDCAISCYQLAAKLIPDSAETYFKMGIVLWLLQDNVLVLKNLMIEAAKRGVDPKQLVFAKRADHGQYLARFQRADLYLDTFIYHAGAIASNALWAGLPVLIKRGRGYTARMAAIKAKLASNRITTPLFNTELFTQHLEAGYQQAYDRYLEGRAPDVIEVTMPV